MDKQVFPTNEAPRIFVSADGDLLVKGSDDLEVQVKADSRDDVSVQEDGDDLRIHCTSDCSVHVPRDAELHVETVHGNAAFKALEGALHITRIDGNLDLRSVGQVTIARVEGNLSIKRAAGDLSVDLVSGNAMVRDIQGSFMVTDKIEGNLNLDDIESQAQAQVSGNATLRFDPLPGQQYAFRVGGNILCRLPEDASAEVNVTSGGRVMVKMAAVETANGDKLRHFVLGDGDARLSLEADGNIAILGQAPDWEMADGFDAEVASEFENMAGEISEQVTMQLEAQMSLLESQLEAQLRHLDTNIHARGISPEVAERISQRAREASTRATARAQEKMARAQERMKRKLEAAERRAEQKVRQAERVTRRQERRTWGIEFPSPQAAAAEQADASALDEERLLILQMLQEKKITAEEADQLLAALEGSDL